MSQLYKLFCEGLRSQKDKEGLSSTLLTSTPVDDDDGLALSPQPAQVVVHSIEPRLQDQDDITTETERDTPSDSVQGQVGSAVSPNLEDDVIVPSKATSSRGSTSGGRVEVLCPNVTKELQGDGKAASNSCDRSTQLSTRPLQERNGNVSPVDFVDLVIAAKRRDKALGIRQKQRPPNSSDESEPQSCGRNATPEEKGNKASDSSETDFEGATEFYQNFPKPCQSSHPSPSETNVGKRGRESSSSRKSSTNESQLNLVLESVSTTSSSSSSSSSSAVIESQVMKEGEILSPPAARCRVYSKPQKAVSSDSESSSDEGEFHNGNQPTVSTVRSQGEGIAQLRTDEQFGKRCDDLSAILKGIVAYVEVRSGHDNRSMGVKTQMRALGATVVDKFCKEVTHVVFNEGSPSTLRRAKTQGCHIVSVLWIEECKKCGTIAPEKDNPPLNMHLYEDRHVMRKYRKMKSLQPDFEEGKSEERLNKHLKRLRSKAQHVLSSQQTNEREALERNIDGEPEAEGSNSKKQSEHLIPDGVVLKTLSVVLKKIDAVDESATSTLSQGRRKRRLMPLRQQVNLPDSLEDFDPAERVRTEIPYSFAPPEKQKRTQPTRRNATQIPPTSQSLRRRSSCFVRGSQPGTQSQYRRKKIKPQMRTMVCTRMHRRDIDVVAAVIKQLGGWILEPTVSPKTTHVVCGDTKRTINLLKGISHGCWILQQEWVMRSLEAGHWLDEEPYELTMFPAIQQCRISRETLGVSPDIFSSAGAIFVARDTTPPRTDLVDLLGLCGAHIVNSARQAKLIIGEHQRRASLSSIVTVNEHWVLDSIQENMLLPVRRYLIS